MRFGFISYNFVGPNHLASPGASRQFFGGAEIYLYDLAQTLIGWGHEVTVIQAGTAAFSGMVDNIKVETISVRRYGSRLGMLEFVRRWPRTVEGRFDRLHLNSLQYVSRYMPSTTTGTCHGVTWDNPPSAFRAAYPHISTSRMAIFEVGRRYERSLARSAVTRLAGIVSVDNFLLKYIQSELPDLQQKIRVVHNYVDASVFRSGVVVPEELRRRYAGRSIVLFPRNLTYQRGTHLLVPMMVSIRKQVPDVLCLVAGDGPLKDRLKEDAAKAGVANHIQLTGHLDHFADLPVYYTLADAVLVPTVANEGTSLSCLEAMAMGRPVVTTDVGGLSEIIEPGYNGWIVKPNADALATAVAEVLTQPAQARNRGKAAIQTVARRFTIERWRENYREFFGLVS